MARQTAVLTAATADTVITVPLMSQRLQAITEAAKAALPAAIKLQAIHLIQVTAAQATAARGLVTAATAITAAIVQVFQQATTEAVITVRLVATNLPTHTTRVAAAQATVVLTAATADTALTVPLI